MKKSWKKTQQVVLKHGMLVSDYWDSLRDVETAKYQGDEKSLKAWLASGQAFQADKDTLVYVKAPLPKTGFVEIKFALDGKEWCTLRTSLETGEV